MLFLPLRWVVRDGPSCPKPGIAACRRLLLRGHLCGDLRLVSQVPLGPEAGLLTDPYITEDHFKDCVLGAT